MGASDISGEDQHDRTETSCSIAVLFKTRSLSNMCFADKPRRLCPACSGDGSTGKISFNLPGESNTGKGGSILLWCTRCYKGRVAPTTAASKSFAQDFSQFGQDLNLPLIAEPISMFLRTSNKIVCLMATRMYAGSCLGAAVGETLRTSVSVLS